MTLRKNTLLISMDYSKTSVTQFTRKNNGIYTFPSQVHQRIMVTDNTKASLNEMKIGTHKIEFSNQTNGKFSSALTNKTISGKLYYQKMSTKKI